MKHTKQPCKCAAYPFPHRHDIKRCVYEDEPSAYAEDERLDSPQHGQASAINKENAQWKQR